MVFIRGSTYVLLACLLSIALVYADTSQKNAESSITSKDENTPIKITPQLSPPSPLPQHTNTKSGDSGGIPWPMILLLLFIFTSLGFICIREILKDWRYNSSLALKTENMFASSRSYGSNNTCTTGNTTTTTMNDNPSSLSYQQESHMSNKSFYNAHSNDYGIYRNVFNTISERLQQYRQQNANRPLGTSEMMFEDPTALPIPALICPPINSKWRTPLAFSEKRIGYQPDNISPALKQVLTRNLKKVKDEEKECDVKININNIQYKQFESKLKRVKKWKRAVSDSEFVGRILKNKNDAHVYSSITDGGRVLFDSSEDEEYDDSDVDLLEDNEISDGCVLTGGDTMDSEKKMKVRKMVIIDLD